jgi:hypothetical protein
MQASAYTGEDVLPEVEEVEAVVRKKA